jgi:hypothetical protein
MNAATMSLEELERRLLDLIDEARKTTPQSAAPQVASLSILAAFAARDAALQASEARVRTLEGAVSAMLKCDCSYFQGDNNVTSEIRELARAALAVTPQED